MDQGSFLRDFFLLRVLHSHDHLIHDPYFKLIPEYKAIILYIFYILHCYMESYIAYL